MNNRTLIRVFWRQCLLMSLFGLGLMVTGCQCLVIVPPVGFQDPGGKPPIARSDDPAALQECLVEVTPQKVVYPLTLMGKANQKKVTITNVGKRVCELSSLRIVGTEPTENKAFFLQEAIHFPYMLMVGQSLVLDVTFLPTAQSTKYKGLLLTDTSSPLRPRVTVELEGESAGPCLEVTPLQLVLGDTQQGCSSNAKQIQVKIDDKPHCPEFVTITGLQLSAGTSDEFSFSKELKLPLKVTRGKSATIDVIYAAKDLGLDQGFVELVIDEAPESFRIPVEGRGVPDNSQTDTFVQQQRSVVDILFVVDSSCSMGDDQENMASNFNSFVKWAIQLKADYHIGVTTTDVTGRRFAPGCLQGETKVITPQTPDPIFSFGKNVRVGTTGSSTEMGLEAAHQALLPHSLAGCNKGFYRPSAVLSVIFVSDEPDQSRQPVDFYIDFFRRLKPSDPQRLLRASAVVGPEKRGCASPSGSAGPGPRYRQVATALGGEKVDICDSNWANTLSKLGIASFGVQNTFQLSRAALESSIVVRVGDKTIPRDPQLGWTYIKATNSVSFSRTFIPEPDLPIRISYKVACQP